MELPISATYPYLWGGQTFTRNDWAPLTFLVGPNGTGKTVLAESMRDQAARLNLRPRFLSAERLGGMERTGHGWFTGQMFIRGWDLGNMPQIYAESRQAGMAVSAFATLRDRLDVRIKVEARLTHLFGRQLRLAEESGYMKVLVSHGGAEYDLKQAESHGLKEIMALLTFLYDDEYNFLLFDEPELHLHPQYQSFFLQEVRAQLGDPLADDAKKAFVLITHSPYILDIRTVEELESVVVFQPDRLPQTAAGLDGQDRYLLGRLMPRLNTHHKQLFFATHPVFVEGYRDQQLFVLIEEARQRHVGAAGSGFIEVGGKTELDTFFRLSSRLGIQCRVITDLDSLLDGNLRQSVAHEERTRSRLAELGGGDDLMTAVGVLISDVDRLETALLQLVSAATDLPQRQRELIDFLKSGAPLISRRSAVLASLGALEAEPVGSDPTCGPLKNAAVGRLNMIVDAMGASGILVLSQGSLEAYLPSCPGPPFGLSESAKTATFDTERTFLLSGPTPAQVDARYAPLTGTLDRATEADQFDLDVFINYALGDLIHAIQTGFSRGEWASEDDLRASTRIDWPRYNRLVTLEAVDVVGDRFTCRLRLHPSVDPKGPRTVEFSSDTVPSRYKLTPLD